MWRCDGSSPWGPLAAVGVAAGLGAALGVGAAPGGASPDSPRAFLATIVAATRAAGSVSSTYHETTTSSNPLLVSSAAGRGVADLASGSGETREQDRSTETGRSGTSAPRAVPEVGSVEQVWIGSTVSTRTATGSGPPPPSWTRVSSPAGSPDSLSPLSTLSPVDTLLDAESVPDLRLARAGTTDAGGTPVTAYRVLAPRCTGAHGGSQTTVLRLEVWIDAGDRLLRATEARRTRLEPSELPPAVLGREPAALALLGGLRGAATRTSTVQLGGFGRPVVVAPPTPLPPPGASGGGSFRVRATAGCLP